MQKKYNFRVIVIILFLTYVLQIFMGIMFNYECALKSSLIAQMSWAYSVNNIFAFKKREQFSWHKFKTNVSAHNLLYGWNVIFPPSISQMYAYLSQQEIKRPPFLDISAQASLPSGLESRHFEIFSCCGLSQIQTPSLFHKPRTSIRSTTLLNLIIDKLPVFFSFDGD